MSNSKWNAKTKNCSNGCDEKHICVVCVCDKCNTCDLRTMQCGCITNSREDEFEEPKNTFGEDFEKIVDMHIYALENTLEKSKELGVAVGHRRVYARIKLISELQGELNAYKEMKEILSTNIK